MRRKHDVGTERALARLTHEDFYLRYAATTNLRRPGSPLSRSTYCFTLLLPRGSRAPVSAVSSRTLVSNPGSGPVEGDYPIAAALPRLSETSPNKVRPIPMRQ